MPKAPPGEGKGAKADEAKGLMEWTDGRTSERQWRWSAARASRMICVLVSYWPSCLFCPDYFSSLFLSLATQLTSLLLGSICLEHFFAYVAKCSLKKAHTICQSFLRLSRSICLWHTCCLSSMAKSLLLSFSLSKWWWHILSFAAKPNGENKRPRNDFFHMCLIPRAPASIFPQDEERP